MITNLLIVIIFIVILYSWLSVVIDARKFNIPGPFPIPIVGNGHLFLGAPARLLQVLSRLAKEHNDAFRFYILSHRYVCLSHPKYIEPLLSSTELITKGRAYDLARPWLGEGILTSTGSLWKSQRKLLVPAFHFSVLQTYLPIFYRNEKTLRAKLTELADGRSINLTGIINALSFDNMTESLMGISFNAQKLAKSEYLTALEDMSKVLAARALNPLLANDWLFNLSPQKIKMDKALWILRKYSDEVIQSRRKELIESNDVNPKTTTDSGMKTKQSVLDLLLLADVEGRKLDDEEIFAQVSTFLFAGHDTLSTGIMFALYCISNHKEVQEKILEEQKCIFDQDMDRDPTFSDLQEMKYLELVIKESLRLYQPVPVMERLITEDTNLAGLRIPKNTFVFINLFEMHRNPKVYDNPMEFIPERFEGTFKCFDWIPFSAGPRNCIGQRFSMLEMKVILSSIVKHFELLPSGREPIISDDIVLKTTNGVYVKIVPRS